MAWRWLPLLLVATTAAAQEMPDGGEPEGPTTGCARAIGPANARNLYDALVALHGADGCTLDDVRTERDTLQVSWKKAGAPVRGAEVRPSACSDGGTTRGAEFSLTVTAEAAAACPDAVAKLTALVGGDGLGPAVHVGRGSGFIGARGQLVVAAAAVALVALVGLVLLWRRRRRAAR